jgi:shikimate dehydrogenase
MMHYGLLGQSLGHSFSKTYFDSFFCDNQIQAEYQNIELPEDQLDQVFNMGLNGFNVTVPYKEKIIPYLDSLSPDAQEIGAVNVVRIINGKRIGFNTDHFGFMQSIKPYFKGRHEKAVLFGTGGSAKAVSYGLRMLGVEIISVSRGNTHDSYLYEDVNETMIGACKLIVNCTPVGMYPKECDALPIPMSFFSKEHLVVDLIYNPEKTELLKFAEEAGATILNGKGMLVYQAEKAWQIWND